MIKPRALTGFYLGRVGDADVLATKWDEQYLCQPPPLANRQKRENNREKVMKLQKKYVKVRRKKGKKIKNRILHCIYFFEWVGGSLDLSDLKNADPDQTSGLGYKI